MALRSCVRDAASACDAVKLGRVATGRELLISTRSRRRRRLADGDEIARCAACFSQFSVFSPHYDDHVRAQ